jgi:hypothetical protein
MFLRQIATDFGAQSATHLRAAVDQYETLAQKHLCSRCPTEIAPMPHMLKKGQAWTQEMRNAQADILTAALPFERAALAEIEKAVAAADVRM